MKTNMNPRALLFLAAFAAAAGSALFSAPAALAQEPARPAACPAPSNPETWFSSVTSTSNTISLTFANPLPGPYSSGDLGLQVCRTTENNIHTWDMSTNPPTAGQTVTVTTYDGTNNLAANTDYWVRLRGAYGPSHSAWHYIRTKAADGGAPAVSGGSPSQAQALKKTLAAAAARTMASALGHIDARFGDAVPPGGLSLALGAAEGEPGFNPADLRWSVWGRGDFASFEGSPRGIRYDGEARTGWLGIDAREGRRVAGLALSHGVSEADYGYAGGGDMAPGTGRLETTLTALYPYGRWTLDDGLELRGVLGAGTGEARHVTEDGMRETADLSMRMGSVGMRKELPPFEGIDLAARADAGTVTMKVDNGPGAIAGVSADIWRLRLGLEASRRFAMENDAALTPFAETVARRDGGDGLAGTGLEVAGGVRYSAPRIEVEARGRVLAAHSENGAREHGMSLTARVGPGAQGRGLSLSLSPRWGAPAASGAQALWRDEMPRAATTGNEAAMNARMGYGITLAREGLLTPFAETGLAAGDGNRRLRLGTRFDAPRMGLGAELSGERRERARAAPGHALRFGLEMRF